MLKGTNLATNVTLQPVGEEPDRRATLLASAPDDPNLAAIEALNRRVSSPEFEQQLARELRRHQVTTQRRSGRAKHRGYLDKGDRGPAVQELKGKLARVGHPVGHSPTYGPKTKDAVRSFQKEMQAEYPGLKADGIAGQATQAVLDAKIGGKEISEHDRARLRLGKKPTAPTPATPETIDQRLKHKKLNDVPKDPFFAAPAAGGKYSADQQKTMTQWLKGVPDGRLKELESPSIRKIQSVLRGSDLPEAKVQKDRVDAVATGRLEDAQIARTRRAFSTGLTQLDVALAGSNIPAQDKATLARIHAEYRAWDGRDVTRLVATGNAMAALREKYHLTGQ